MRILWTITILFAFALLLAPSTPAFAQDQRDEDKAKPQEQAKPPEPVPQPEGNRSNAGKQGTAAQAQQEQTPPREEHKKQNEASRPSQQHEGMPQAGHNQRPVKAQRGKKIPDPKFRASFGRQHTFKVQRTEVINVQQPTIVVGGYSFILVDVWPVEWGFDDPCYIDFVDDEYFLFDDFHPGIRIALFVVE